MPRQQLLRRSIRKLRRQPMKSKCLKLNRKRRSRKRRFDPSTTPPSTLPWPLYPLIESLLGLAIMFGIIGIIGRKKCRSGIETDAAREHLSAKECS
mmetsp:Transcript_8959/g.26831  ORF Transcript_8959/g.26831 Transcript_8959/m.26831 type:complete len:96 (-) Transcript_8959:3210-3497(-)